MSVDIKQQTIYKFINMDKYLISSDDCLILLALHNSSSLREAARNLDCDPGGLLRKVQKIASEHDVLRKNQGRWELTNKGLALVSWTQENILGQKRLLLSETTIRIAATTWFAERLLIPEVLTLHRQLKTTDIQFSIPDSGFESALLEGDCDFVVVCHPPENPAIAHKRICQEKWSLVISEPLFKKNFSGRKGVTLQDFLQLPFIQHHGMNSAATLSLESPPPNMFFASMDNLIGVRSALIHGAGWSFVPTLLVKEEIENGSLIEIEHRTKMDRNVCLWWQRNSIRARQRASQLESWLSKVCAKI